MNRLLLFSVTCLVLFTACGGDDTERGSQAPASNEAVRSPWTHLAQGYEPNWKATPGTRADRFRATEDPNAFEVHHAVPAENWIDEGKGLWSAERMTDPFEPLQVVRQGSTFTADGEKVGGLAAAALAQFAVGGPERWREGRMPRMKKAKRPAAFFRGDRAYLLLDEDAWPPTRTVIKERARIGAPHAGRYRVDMGGRRGDAIPILSGGAVEVEVDAAAGSTLSFRGRAGGSGTVTLKILEDGVELGEVRLPVGDVPVNFERFPLADRAGTRTLRFDAVLGAGVAVLFSPVVGPSETATYGSRPYDSSPDVVLLQADTFRADNLAAWGGDPRIAPSLNDFASGSRRYLNTHAAGTWTLPSHASMFGGRYPYQLGVSTPTSRLPEEVTTVAEQFQAAGYRTVAISDGSFVSPSFGMDQGFEVFEISEGLEAAETLEETQLVLQADDGRPLFLFVQSYRAHNGSDLNPEVVQRLADAYTPTEPKDFNDPVNMSALKEFMQDQERGADLRGVPEYEAFFGGRYETYRVASANADLVMEGVLAALDRYHVLDTGVIAFTSDHGEEFGEHGMNGHGTGVWENQSWVPLIVRAPGLAAEDDPRPASLVDLPRTLTSLAGVPPAKGWEGVDLTGAPVDQMTYSFIGYPARTSEIAATGGRWKVLFAEEDGPAQVRFVYHLGDDPQESVSRAADIDPALMQQLREGAQRAATPALDASTAEVDDERAQQIRAMGYGGDEDE